MPKLIYKDPETGSQVVVEINEELSEVTIGRNPGNIIRINNPSVSRRHTKFVYENGACSLHDLNSSNGTYVNGIRIQNQVLEDGDLVRVGEFPLEFVDDVEPMNTAVEEGHIADAIDQSSAKSTVMGMGSAGHSDELGDAGGQMMQTEASVEPAESTSHDEFVIGEDDIEEIVEEEQDPYASIEEDGFTDDTIDGGAEIAASLQALRSGGQLEASAEDADYEGQTRRADGDALSMQDWEQAIGGDEAGEQSEEVEALRQQVDELRAQLETAPEQDEVRKLRSERDEAREQNNNLESENESLQAELEIARQELESHSADDGSVQALEAELGELRQQLDAKNDDIDRLSTQNDELQAEIGHLQEELAKRDQTIKTLETNLDERSETLANRDSQIQSLERELEDAQDSSDGVSGADDEELQALRDEVAAFEEERQKKTAIFKELSADLRGLVETNDALSKQIEELKSELSAVRDERDQLLDASPSETAPVGDGSDAYEQLVEEKQTLEDTLAELILERDRLEDELHKVREAS